MNIRERIRAALLGECIKLNYVRVGIARNITRHAEVYMKMNLMIIANHFDNVMSIPSFIESVKYLGWLEKIWCVSLTKNVG